MRIGRIAVRADPRSDRRVRGANIHDAALKHGLAPDDIRQAASRPLWVEDLDDDSLAHQLRLGFDSRGRLLETVVLMFDSGNELVVHAMKARPQMLDLLL